MTDIIDDANARFERDLELSIAAQRRKAEQQAARPLPTECDNGCGDPPRERSRYCSNECREDHESRLTRAKRMGAR